MSQIFVNNKRLSMISSMFLPPPPPFIESKEQENYKLGTLNPNGVCLPPSPSEVYGHEKWHDIHQDEDYFSFPANYLATPSKAHSTHAFARLDTTNENINKTVTNLSQKATQKTDDENLTLQLEDTAIPPMSSSCSTSTSEESDIDDLNQENSTNTYKSPVLQKRLTRDFDSYVSEFIHYSKFNNMKGGEKKPETSAVFKNFF